MDDTLIQAFGPLGAALIKFFGWPGVALALGIIALRAVWPWLRDVYLVARIATMREQAAAWSRLVELVERNTQQIAEARADVAATRQDIADVRQDIAALYERGRSVRPSRRPVVSANKGAS